MPDHQGETDTDQNMSHSGGLLLLAGLVVYFFHDNPHWIGRLPGDIRVEKENFRFYFPITTMILFSRLITALIAVIHRFF